MKITYDCPICRDKWMTASSLPEVQHLGTEPGTSLECVARTTALACERRGRMDLTRDPPPVGLLFGSRDGPSLRKGERRQEAHGFIYCVQGVEHDRHGAVVWVGIFRGNGCGDTYRIPTVDNARVAWSEKPDNLTALPEEGLVWCRSYPDIMHWGPYAYGDHEWRDWRDVPVVYECAALDRAIAAVKRAGREPTLLTRAKGEVGRVVMATGPIEPWAEATHGWKATP